MQARYIKRQQFWTQKAGNADEEYEDAFADNLGKGDAHRIHVAIADGATEYSFSRLWARALVERFVCMPTAHLTPKWLEPAQKEFAGSIDIAALPWHAQEKAGQGTFSTLLGLSVNLAKGDFRVLATGDSCVVIVPEAARHVHVLPRIYTNAKAFGNRPYLIGSHRAKRAQLRAGETSITRHLGPGRTSFLLMTDALGAWFAQARQNKEEPWNDLLELDSNRAFVDLVNRLRARQAIRNDDMTLLRLDVYRDRY